MPRDIVIAGVFVAPAISRSPSTTCSRCARSGAHERALSRRGTRRLHQLLDRPQHRRQRVHRRRGALPHLFAATDCPRSTSPSSASSPGSLSGSAMPPCSGSASSTRRARPAAIDQLPRGSIAWSPLVALVVLASYVAWVWRVPRRIGHQNWEVTLPNGPLTLLQIGIGIVDLACCAARDVHAGAERALYRLHRAQRHLRLGDAARASPAIRPAGLACSTPRCWWRSGNTTRKTCSPGCCCSGCCITSCRSRSRLPFSAAANSGSASPAGRGAKTLRPPAPRSPRDSSAGEPANPLMTGCRPGRLGARDFADGP